MVSAPNRAWSKRDGLRAASEAARALARGFGDIEDVMRGVAESSEAGWVAATLAAHADADERLRIQRGCVEAVRGLYVDILPETAIDAAVEEIERVVGMRDVVFKWSDRGASVALWRIDGEPIDLVRLDDLELAAAAARLWFHRPTVGEARAVVALLQRATCCTGRAVADAVHDFAGVAAALSHVGYTPAGVARALVRARAEALAASAQRV